MVHNPKNEIGIQSRQKVDEVWLTHSIAGILGEGGRGSFEGDHFNVSGSFSMLFFFWLKCELNLLLS